MSKKFIINIAFKGGGSSKFEIQDEDALEDVFIMLMDHPGAHATIMTAEYEPDTPYKQVVKFDSYENQAGRLIKLDY